MSYNIFNQVHLPLKLALLSGCTALSENNFPDFSSAAKAVSKVEQALATFHHQQKFETENLLPLIFEYEPSIWVMCISEHHKVNNLARDVENITRTYKRSEITSEKQELMARLVLSFNDFVLYNFNHMDNEEPILNEILWRYYDDKFIQQKGAEIGSIMQGAGTALMSMAKAA